MTTQQQVLAIWLESADFLFTKDLMNRGLLPTWEKLQMEGTFAKLQGPEHTFSETAHPMLITGCHPQRTGGWSSQPYLPKTYELRPTEDYHYDRFRPFYHFTPDHCTVIFDLSEIALFPEIAATQISSWGAHAP